MQVLTSWYGFWSCFWSPRASWLMLGTIYLQNKHGKISHIDIVTATNEDANAEFDSNGPKSKALKLAVSYADPN